MIIKELKRCKFEWNGKVFRIATFFEDEAGGCCESVELSKVEAFSLVRFLIRVCQKNFRFNRKENK